MLGEWLRNHTRWLVDPIARATSRLGISPNWITVLGLVANVVVALLIVRGYLRIGGVATLLATLFDAFDGAPFVILRRHAAVDVDRVFIITRHRRHRPSWNGVEFQRAAEGTCLARRRSPRVSA